MEYSGDKKHRISKKLKRFFSASLDIIFPRFCVICGQEGSFLCQDCCQKIKKQELSCPYCRRLNFSGEFCARHQKHSNLSGLIFVCQFDSLAQRIVYAFKYQGLRGLSEFLASEMANKLKEHPIFKNDPVLVPAPIFITKRWRRGFNQTELLAFEIAQKLSLETAPLLFKVRNTVSQTKLGLKDRFNNLNNAFMLSATSINFQNRSLVLVDDVYTTGVTLNEMAKELKKLRPLSIWGLAFARGG